MDKKKYEALKIEFQKELYQSKKEKGLMPEEAALVKSIRTETAKWNKNNITRNQAYLAYYEKNHEFHWAFLAHMVSRNGGYHMTDLKGSAMDHLFTSEDKKSIFYFWNMRIQQHFLMLIPSCYYMNILNVTIFLFGNI